MRLDFLTLGEQEGTLTVANSMPCRWPTRLAIQGSSRDGSMRDVVENFLSLQFIILEHFAQHLQAYFFLLILTTILGNKQNHFPDEEIGSKQSMTSLKSHN